MNFNKEDGQFVVQNKKGKSFQIDSSTDNLDLIFKDSVIPLLKLPLLSEAEDQLVELELEEFKIPVKKLETELGKKNSGRDLEFVLENFSGEWLWAVEFLTSYRQENFFQKLLFRDDFYAKNDFRSYKVGNLTERS